MKHKISLFWRGKLRPVLRRTAASILRVLPIPTTAGGIPTKVIWDAAEWIRETERRRPSPDGKPRNWQVKVRDAEEIAGPPPRSIESPIPQIFEKYARVKYPELTVTAVRRGRVATSEGTVLSPDDRVFDQFTHTWGDPIWKNKVFQKPGLGRLRRREGTWATLVVPAAQVNVGHWLMDGVIRLSVLEAAGAAGQANFIVPEMLEKNLEPLEALGYGPERCAGLDEGYWEADSLLIPSYLSTPGFIRPWGVRWLRNRLGVEDRPAGQRRLWISRCRARYRRLWNEEDLWPILERAGFEKVELESLPFRSQVDLLAQAGAVAGPHGAGMTDLLFAPRGIPVLEVFPPEFINPVFYSMANSLDQEYYFLTGYSPAEDRNAEGARDLDHFRLDPQKLTVSLKRMGLFD
ncbi:MAG: glycosyltransferase family 61 protein [Anaerolineales bacterium]|nr:glycosyltransferase family 61 protein [Anaerolineales bacterium]